MTDSLYATYKAVHQHGRLVIGTTQQAALGVVLDNAHANMCGFTYLDSVSEMGLPGPPVWELAIRSALRECSRDY